MSFYADSKYPVRGDVESIHEQQLRAFGQPGTWFEGAERVALAAEVRDSRVEAGVQEAAGHRPAEPADIPEAARRVARQVAVEPQILEREFYHQALADGLSDGQYIELIGLVSRLTNIDIVARGLGLPVRPLPVPVSGEPSRERPNAATEEGAWAATVPAGVRGGDDARALYGDAMMPFIIRALSLVPAELRNHIELEQAQYLPLERFPEFDYQHHDGLTRPQVEVIAGRVSVLNDCFY